ncbi:MAG: hypothetical protein ACK2UM_12840 [Anaerolineales bacterium]|jgi:hypothetical protein
MYRVGIFIRVLLAILLVAVIVAGGVAIYRAGWAQGFRVSTITAGGEEIDSGMLVPGFGGYMYGPHYPGFGFPFFGVCLGIGFIFLIMFLVRGLLRPWGAGYPHYGKWRYGPMPPWVKDWEEFRQKKAGEKEAGEDPGEGQSSSRQA